MILPDYLASGLRVVITGTAAGRGSAARGHYYAGQGNEFWKLLHEAGLTTDRLAPEQDALVLEFGIGLTDLAKQVAASSDAGLGSHYDVDTFTTKIEAVKPQWVAFHGKEAAKVVSQALGHGRSVQLGEQDWSVGGARVFVLPSASGANRGTNRLEGKSSRLEWFRELSERVGST